MEKSCLGAPEQEGRSSCPRWGKGDPAHLTRRERQEAEWRASVAFFPEGLNEQGIDKLAGVAASLRNEHGGTHLLHAGSPSGLRLLRDVRVFACFLAVGMNPPLSLSS